MIVKHLTMPPYNTTLMGVVHGALRHFGRDLSAATVFGVSGHAFLVNIHTELCPSGPYVWNHEGFFRLIEHLGIRSRFLGFFSGESGRQERSALEAEVRKALDSGKLASLSQMENQLIAGYDDTGLSLVRPWDCGEGGPPARLTYGSWNEFGTSVHASFFVLEPGEPSAPLDATIASLEYALDLSRSPERYAVPGYAIGSSAYKTWAEAIPQHGATHGQWWNATVWSECRAMASARFREIADTWPAAGSLAGALSVRYQIVARSLAQAADKQMENGAKVELIRQAGATEADAMPLIKELIDVLARES